MLPSLQDVNAIPIFGVKLHAFGFLVGLAIVVGVIVAGRRARRLGLSEKVVADVALWCVVGGFIVAHLYSALFYFPEKVFDNPDGLAGGLWYLVSVWDGISSVGGFLGAVLAAIWYFRRNPELSFFAYADTIIYGFAFAWIFGRLGCTVAFDHVGSETDFFLGMEHLVQRAKDGPWHFEAVRHNLGFYEVLWASTMAIFFWSQRNRAKATGWYLGMFVVCYMPLRFAADFVRQHDATAGGLTPAQWIAIPMFCIGVWALLRANKRSELLLPDGKPKHRPIAEQEALQKAEAQASASPKVGQSKSSQKNKKGKKKR